MSTYAHQVIQNAPMLIYPHFPKSAGTSMMEVLRKNYGLGYKRLKTEGDKILWINMPEDEKRKITCLTGHFPHGLHEFVPWDCQYVTMLREPVDRVLSFYYYIKGKSKHQLAPLFSKMTIDELLESETIPGFSNEMTRFLAGRKDIGIRKPYDRTNEVDLELAKIRLRKHYLFGFSEYFDETLDRFATFFGWKITAHTDWLVNTLRPPVSDVPEPILDVIVKHNKQDIALYHYALELAGVPV